MNFKKVRSQFHILRHSRIVSPSSVLQANDLSDGIAADFEEETGGKWRAGDAAKSGRAFLRAIDIYNNGLARYPTNFDLAYNK